MHEETKIEETLISTLRVGSHPTLSLVLVGSGGGHPPPPSSSTTACRCCRWYRFPDTASPLAIPAPAARTPCSSFSRITPRRCVPVLRPRRHASKTSFPYLTQPAHPASLTLHTPSPARHLPNEIMVEIVNLALSTAPDTEGLLRKLLQCTKKLVSCVHTCVVDLIYLLQRALAVPLMYQRIYLFSLAQIRSFLSVML